MAVFDVEICETLSKIITIEAETEIDALKAVRQKYKDGEITLYPDDFIGSEILLYKASE